MIEELAQRVFEARNAAHVAHWKTKSYAAHVALGAFYDDVISAIDAVIEAYQGAFGAIGAFPFGSKAVKDITDYLQEEYDWIEENREEICQGSPTVGNLIDSLAGVYAKTLFLLGMK